MEKTVKKTMLPVCREIILALLITLAVVPVAVVAEPALFGECAIRTTAPKAVEDALDGVLKQILHSELGSAPGGVLSVRARGWRYVKSAGVADLGSGSKMGCSMPFQIGSNTKMMTAVILLQLHEEGALSMDDPLSSHLPEIAAKLPNGKRMTLRQLAQHTSGVFSYTDDAPDGTPGLMQAGTTDPEALRRDLSPEDMVDFVIKHGTPGREGVWRYSNTGYTLLGMVIEKVEQRPLGKSFEKRIFSPLDMGKTYMWNGIPRPAFGLPRSYLEAPFNYETTTWNMSQGWAAGAVISTVDDMHIFMEALVAGDLFRSPETLSIMQKTVRTQNPVLLGYGIGLALKGDGLWGHGGQTLGFESDVAAFQGRAMSMVAWGTSSSNIMAFAAFVISNALRKAGALSE